MCSTLSATMVIANTERSSSSMTTALIPGLSGDIAAAEDCGLGGAGDLASDKHEITGDHRMAIGAVGHGDWPVSKAMVVQGVGLSKRAQRRGCMTDLSGRKGRIMIAA